MTGTDDAGRAAGTSRPAALVGVDGSGESHEVCAHALVAAARRGADLLVVPGIAVELCRPAGERSRTASAPA